MVSQWGMEVVGRIDEVVGWVLLTPTLPVIVPLLEIIVPLPVVVMASFDRRPFGVD